MAYNLGLSIPDAIRYNRLLGGSHRVRINLDLLDLNMNLLSRITNSFMTGSVSIDTSGDISRSANYTLSDFSRTLALAPLTPRSDGTAYPTRMIRTWYGVGEPDGSWWVDVPVFTGPLTKVSRNTSGTIVQVECMGKESLSNGTFWSAKSYNPGWEKTTLVRNILAYLSGEAYFRARDTKQITSAIVAIDRDHAPWATAKGILADSGFNLFYDGMGYAKIEPLSDIITWSFDPRFTLDNPNPEYDLEALCNAAEVQGVTPEGMDDPISAQYVAPAAHPLSPQSLGRNGVPRYVPTIEQNNDLLTVEDCYNRAREIVREGLLSAVNCSFPSLPVPHLEEGDLVEVNVPGYYDMMRFKTGTIPLDATQAASFGYTKSVPVSKVGRITKV